MAGSNLFAALGQQLKSTVVQRVVGLAAVVLVGGTVAAVMLLGHRAAPQATPSVAVAPAHVPIMPHSAPQLATASTHPGGAATVVSVGSRGVATRPVVAEGNGTPVVTAVSQGTVSPSGGTAHLDDHLTYQYNALGRRDPFQSLVDGAFVGADVGGDAPPDPGGIKVVGIVWGATDQFALVEDVRGNSFVLRKGDKVQNGYVEALKRDGVTVNITAEGQSQSVVIPLVRKGEQNAR